MGLQRVEEEAKDDSLNFQDKEAIVPVPLAPIQLHQKNPQKNQKHLSYSLIFSEPSLKVSYQKLRALKE